MAYSLVTSYLGESLLSGFNWFDGVDPSHGYVSYQSRDNARSLGLYSVHEDTGVVRLGVDHTNIHRPGQGRPSIRLESKETYDKGLFIADFLHMPPSKCGLWPAFWAYGADWPDNGEVDIIEGVNTNTRNLMSAHTRSGCTQAPSLLSRFSGQQRNVECAVGSDNIGCGYDPPPTDDSSYGDGFNLAGGGVYAMQWDSEHIRLWHFARDDIPADIDDKQPDPATWGLPQALFGGLTCDVSSYWRDMRLVINTNFCGDFGQGVWGKTDNCNVHASTCAEYVANNPGVFSDAYWDVRYIDVYALADHAHSINSTAPAKATPSTASKPRTSTPANSSSKQTHARPSSIPGSTTRSSSMPLSTTHAASSVVSVKTNSTTVSVMTTSVSAISPSTNIPGPPVSKTHGFSYLGCFESNSSFSTFSIVQDSNDMAPARCAKLCSGKTYAALFDSRCFCADSMDQQTKAASEGTCNRSCPGAASEMCGGESAVRQLSGRPCFSLSVYRSDGDARPSRSATPSTSDRPSTTSVSLRTHSLISPNMTSTVGWNATTLGTKHLTTTDVFTATRYVFVSPIAATRSVEQVTVASTVVVTEHCGCVENTSVAKTRTVTTADRGRIESRTEIGIVPGASTASSASAIAPSSPSAKFTPTSLLSSSSTPLHSQFAPASSSASTHTSSLHPSIPASSSTHALPTMVPSIKTSQRIANSTFSSTMASVPLHTTGAPSVLSTSSSKAPSVLPTPSSKAPSILSTPSKAPSAVSATPGKPSGTAQTLSRPLSHSQTTNLAPAEPSDPSGPQTLRIPSGAGPRGSSARGAVAVVAALAALLVMV